MRISMSLIRWIAFGCLLSVAACEPGGDLPVLSAPGPTASYKLSTGDQVRVITFGETGLTGQFAVDDGGNVALPLLGPVKADGLTTDQLAATISATLQSRKLLASPSVVVEVASYRPVFVLGEVQKPGQFPFQPHMTMLSAVALAGGFTPRAVTSRASVVRTEADKPTEGQVSRDSLIEPGDIITILERHF